LKSYLNGNYAVICNFSNEFQYGDEFQFLSFDKKFILRLKHIAYTAPSQDRHKQANRQTDKQTDKQTTQCPQPV